MTEAVVINEELEDNNDGEEHEVIINHFIIHKVYWRYREGHPKEASFKHRDNENNVDALSSQVVDLLGGLFKTTSLAAGQFNSDKEVEDGEPPIPPTIFESQLRRNFVDGQFTNFLTFSKEASRDFALNHWGEEGAAKAGYLLFYVYTFNHEKFLAIVMLHETKGMKLDDSLTLSSVDQLDLSTLHLAVRINLTSWLDPDDLTPKYLHFRLGNRAGEMRKFFTNFIGCDEYINQKSDTNALKLAIETYCMHIGYDIHRQNTILQEAVEYVSDMNNHNADGQVSLVALSNRLFPNTPDEFRVHAQDNQNLSMNIGIHKRTLNDFTNYSGSSPRISIKFVRSALGNEVIFDEEAGTLLINSVPEALINMLTSDNEG
ncbi:nucleoid-associated protein [Aeromonas hydrophila]|uniref:nucleoid-associated protein n=1 Tax=Aeromonas hydrophila TaxID=644 RepID=UPI00191E081B|nr:nucleoid-associated protein [Aeromonas hydrophila]MBL0670733.1 nucleoid-associated protein [Aeromonas hydrophila]